MPWIRAGRPHPLRPSEERSGVLLITAGLLVAVGLGVLVALGFGQ